MIAEPFAYGNSPMHRIDPRLKIVSATIFSFIVALSDLLTVGGVALGLSILMVLNARLNSLEVMKRLIVVNGFIVFLWVVVPLTFEGETLFKLGILSIAKEGVDLCLEITLKSNAIVLAFIALIATSPMSTIGNGLTLLRIPEKMVHLMLLTYRYIHVIEDEYQKLVKAAKIRNFKPGTNVHTYKTYAYLVGMLFVRASWRAERVHQAMLCRGFSGKFYCLHQFAFTRLDRIWLMVMIGVFCCLIWLEWA